MQTTEEKMYKRIVREQTKRTKRENVSNLNHDPNLLNISNAADEYYVLLKLKTYCAYLNWQKIINAEKIPYSEKDFRLINCIITEVENGSFQEPLIELYNQIRLLYQNKAVDFDQLIEQTRQLTDKINTDEGLEIYSFLTSICTQKINQGENQRRKTLFLLYNDMLKLFAKNKRKKTILPSYLFKNMVSIALYLKDDPIFDSLETPLISKLKDDSIHKNLQWTQQFIEVYQKNIDKKTAATFLDYSKALLAFHQQKYGRAYHHLQYSLNTHGLFINMDYKILYLKTLYELQYSPKEVLKIPDKDLKDTIEAYRKLLAYETQEAQKLGYHYEYYDVFYQTFKLLDAVQHNLQDASMKKELLQVIEQLPNYYAFKAWFLEKYRLIKNQK